MKKYHWDVSYVANGRYNEQWYPMWVKAVSVVLMLVGMALALVGLSVSYVPVVTEYVIPANIIEQGKDVVIDSANYRLTVDNYILEPKNGVINQYDHGRGIMYCISAGLIYLGIFAYGIVIDCRKTRWVGKFKQYWVEHGEYPDWYAR